MNLLSDRERWGWVARLLHWVTAALVAVQFAVALEIAMTDDLVLRFEVTQVHKSWGAVIFGLVVLRLVWRLVDRERPAVPTGMAGWQARAARTSHGLLYGALLAVPIAGWVYASASPLQTLMQVDNEVFGIFVLPDPWPVGSETLADSARLTHLVLAVAFLALIVVHAGAALGHQFVRRDGVLARMTWRR